MLSESAKKEHASQPFATSDDDRFDLVMISNF